MSATVSAWIFPSTGPAIRAVAKGDAALKAASPALAVQILARRMRKRFQRRMFRMTDHHNVIAFPIASWAGRDPSALATELIAVERRGGVDARNDVLCSAIRDVRVRLEAMRLPRRLPGAMLAKWINTTIAEEYRLRRRADQAG